MSKTGYELVLDLSGPEGNAMVVVGRTSDVLKQCGLSNEANDIAEKMFKCGSYEEVLLMCNEYVDLVDSSNSYTNILGEVNVVTTVTRV